MDLQYPKEKNLIPAIFWPCGGKEADMGRRTDIAIESTQLREGLPGGVEQRTDTVQGVDVTTVRIVTEEAARLIGKAPGDYATIEAASLRKPTDSLETEVEVLAHTLTGMLPEKGMVLVAGLGNSDITPDALGPKVLAKIFATRHISGNITGDLGLGSLREVAAMTTGVLGQTGMESAEIIAAVCKDTRPAAVIAVDALACSDIDRLGSTVQVTDTGISPGSGVQNARKELSKATLGVPVIAIGLPTVVDMTTIASDLLGEEDITGRVSERGGQMMVTPREIDLIIERASRLISLGINRALQPELSVPDIEALIS